MVSEAGLERLTKKLELEFMWENSMAGDDKKTLIVAGSALELLIEFSNNVVQSVALNFPDSAEIVNKHAEAAGSILFKDLQLGEAQSPLTKSLAPFAANFERLAVLDKLSVNPGLNLYEAVAGIYESLCRLHAWELQKTREDPTAAAKGEEYLRNLVLCTKSGMPTMNAKGRVGMTLDYWKQRRLQPPLDPALAAWTEKNEQTWSILIGCASLGEIGVNPVRISDKWIGPNIEKMALGDELHAGGPIIDWQEPESTFVPTPDPTKADPMQPDPSLLGPRLPDVVFHATFDPPVHIPATLWEQIQTLGCSLDGPALKDSATFDSLVLPYPPGKETVNGAPRTVLFSKKTPFVAPGETKLSLKTHNTTLSIPKPIASRTLTTMTFSHPQQLITVLPYLRQYAFLATLLQTSLTQLPSNATRLVVRPNPSTTTTTTTPKPTKTITTTVDDYTAFLSPEQEQSQKEEQQEEEPLSIDITLTQSPTTVPRLRALFPFRGEQTADVTLEIRENGRVGVVAQDVLDLDAEGNVNMEGVAAAGGGRRQRRQEDVGGLLEACEDLGKWAEFIRSRWA